WLQRRSVEGMDGESGRCVPTVLDMFARLCRPTDSMLRGEEGHEVDAVRVVQPVNRSDAARVDPCMVGDQADSLSCDEVKGVGEKNFDSGSDCGLNAFTFGVRRGLRATRGRA